MASGAETFTDRFNRLTAHLSVTKIAGILDVTEGSIRKLRRGDTQTIELHRALRLCRVLRVSPFYLAGEREPALQEIEAESYNTREITRLAPVDEMALLPQAVATLEQKLAATNDRLALAIVEIQRLVTQQRQPGKLSKQA